MDVPDDTPPQTRVCSCCRKSKPETREYFYQTPLGAFAAACRICNNAKNLAVKRRRSGSDGAHGQIMKTHGAIKTAFRTIDPGGSEGAELRRKLSGVVRRFQAAPYDEKAEVAAWFMKEFLRPTS